MSSYSALTAPPIENPAPGAKRILLAEDDLDDQELLIEAIEHVDAHFQVYTINNGNKTISFLEKLEDDQLPSLIILDYNLPEVNGGQILQILNANLRYKPIPKVVWSTSNSPLYKTQCLELGAKAYMVKPSDINSIQNMAQQMLAFCNSDNHKG
jgi:CheY-like chemotaxis protein